MNRSKILFMILIFCSVMLVFYAAVQYWQGAQNKKEAESAVVELGRLEVETAEVRVFRDSLRSVLHKCCPVDSTKNVGK